MLSKAEKEFLKGKEVSEEYRYKLLQRIRKKLQKTSKDMHVLLNSNYWTEFRPEITSIVKTSLDPLFSQHSLGTMWAGRDSNPRPAVCETAVITI